MLNHSDFELVFNSTFGDVSRNGLLYEFEGDNSLQIELGGQGDNVVQRLEQAYNRSNQILQYCLGRKSIWLKMVLWTDREEKNLLDAGFEMYKATNVFKEKIKYKALEEYEASGEYNLLYIHFKHYSKVLFSPIIRSIINYDMAVDPSAQITCYYINFNSKLIINIYDDRGVNIYTPNSLLHDKIKNKFYDWLI